MAQEWKNILKEEMKQDGLQADEIKLTPDEELFWSNLQARISKVDDASQLASAETVDLFYQLRPEIAPPEDLVQRLEAVANRALRDREFASSGSRAKLGDYIRFLRCKLGLRVDQVSEDVEVDYDIMNALESNRLSFEQIMPTTLVRVADYLSASYDTFLSLLPSLLDNRGPALAGDTGLFRASQDMSAEERARMIADAEAGVSSDVSDTLSSYLSSRKQKDQEKFGSFLAEVKGAWRTK